MIALEKRSHIQFNEEEEVVEEEEKESEEAVKKEINEEIRND